jgi:hypothetical protein
VSNSLATVLVSVLGRSAQHDANHIAKFRVQLLRTLRRETRHSRPSRNLPRAHLSRETGRDDLHDVVAVLGRQRVPTAVDMIQHEAALVDVAAFGRVALGDQLGTVVVVAPDECYGGVLCGTTYVIVCATRASALTSVGRSNFEMPKSLH